MLKLPKRIKSSLEKDNRYYSFVIQCVSNLESWISVNNTVFFPEYTDHGPNHLNEVLLTADSIISDESWEQITAQDAAAMTISILLHDCAMHITEDGFYSLINDKMPEVNSKHFEKEKSWSETWQLYYSEARRFDSGKLISIFGDDNPVKKIPENKIDLDGRDRLLIGEFIRRNHARIAHEIAFYGVPGLNGDSIMLPEQPDNHFLDLCGFIARSHNLPLRGAVDRLEQRKRQVHLNTHVPFIMLVLRISDYIQIHSERAPEQLLHLKGLVSPISRGEWKKHHSIVEINQAHEDPEAIYIDAEPNDAITYEELRKLFLDIQLELDQSWSVLGEVYGRYAHLNNLGITIRRIRSSLDNTVDFIKNKNPNYIPKVLKFRTADSEMMELLIKPLYGDKPAVGIRELLQNSVDACSELIDLQMKRGLYDQSNGNFDVCVSLVDNDDGGLVIIDDYGIGMKLDTIENYFLNIGASFRNSDLWKKEHESEGRSNVHRTGRFGIGLLAAYLLGDKLSVETRHVDEEFGLYFDCEKGSKKIIVNQVECHPGTKITIKVSDEVKEYLIENQDEWDWFSLDKPKVVRKVINDGVESTLEQSRFVPNSNEKIDHTGWYRIEDDSYDDISWTYTSDWSNHPDRIFHRDLICNGVIVSETLRLKGLSVSKKLGIIRPDTPNLNVFDQDGRLPINLERTDLIDDRVPFIRQLSKGISDYLAREFHHFFKSVPRIGVNVDTISEISQFSVDGLARHYYSSGDELGLFFISGRDLVPVDYDLVRLRNINEFCVDAANLSKSRGAWNSKTFSAQCENYIAYEKVSDSKQSRVNFVRKFFELNSSYGIRKGLQALPICGRRILMRKKDVEELVTPGNIPKTFWQRLDLEWQNETWSLMCIGETPELRYDIDAISSELSKTSSFGFVICYLDWSESEEECSPFSKSWMALEQN